MLILVVLGLPVFVMRLLVPILGQFGALCAHFGAVLDFLCPLWGGFGAPCANLGWFWGSLYLFKALCAHFGVVLGLPVSV